MKKIQLSILAIFNIIEFTSLCPRIISRQQWEGKHMETKIQPLIQPVFYFIIHQSSSPTCYNQTSCALQMRNIQNFHVHSHNLDDIAYNFCFGQDGNVYEGLGWDVKGGDASAYNRHAINLCFIGSFENALPNFKSFLAAQELILCGINKGKVSPAYSLIAHRQISTSDPHCPGRALFMEIQRNLRFDYNPIESIRMY